MQKRAFENEVLRHHTWHNIFKWMASPDSTLEVYEICQLKVKDTPQLYWESDW